MKIALLGSTGTVGRALPLLAQHHDVPGVSRLHPRQSGPLLGDRWRTDGAASQTVFAGVDLPVEKFS